MKKSTKQTYEYQKGFSDGFKEGYNKALEDMQIKKQYELSTKTVVIVKKDSKSNLDFNESRGVIICEKEI